MCNVTNKNKTNKKLSVSQKETKMITRSVSHSFGTSKMDLVIELIEIRRRTKTEFEFPIRFLYLFKHFIDFRCFLKFFQGRRGWQARISSTP